MKSDKMARLRAGYQTWLRNMRGEAEPSELPDIELTPNAIRQIAEAVAIPDPPSAPPHGTVENSPKTQRKKPGERL
jgi:hypothetical protein